jgi:hypothetical protein
MVAGRNDTHAALLEHVAYFPTTVVFICESCVSGFEEEEGSRRHKSVIGNPRET